MKHELIPQQKCLHVSAGLKPTLPLLAKKVGSNGFVMCAACVSRTLIACLDALMATFYREGPMAIDIEARRFDNNCAEGLWKIVIPYAYSINPGFQAEV